MVHQRRLPPAPWLLAFEAAARHQSFSRAARALGTSQPAISQRIGQLEAELGVALFRRLSRGVALTGEGARLLAALTDGFDLIESAVAELRRAGPSEHLAVATDFGFAAFWLLPRLHRWRTEEPGIDVRVVTSQSLIDPQRDGVDVAIVFGPAAWPGCTAALLFPEIVLPVCSPSFLEGRRRPRVPGDLLCLPLLHLEGVSGRWLDWKGWFDAAGVAAAAPVRGFAIDNYILLIQAALAGEGIALGWRPLVDDLLAGGKLVAALDLPVSTAGGYYLVEPRNRAGNRIIKTFRRWLIAETAR